MPVGTRNRMLAITFFFNGVLLMWYLLIFNAPPPQALDQGTDRGKILLKYQVHMMQMEMGILSLT